MQGRRQAQPVWPERGAAAAPSDSRGEPGADANKRDKQLLREHFEELEGESEDDEDGGAGDGGSSMEERSDEEAPPVRAQPQRHPLWGSV